jgi:hypothetical protein
LRKTIYYDFNIFRFREKLSECHGIDLSHETLKTDIDKRGLTYSKDKKKGRSKKEDAPFMTTCPDG